MDSNLEQKLRLLVENCADLLLAAVKILRLGVSSFGFGQLAGAMKSLQAAYDQVLLLVEDPSAASAVVYERTGRITAALLDKAIPGERYEYKVCCYHRSPGHDSLFSESLRGEEAALEKAGWLPAWCDVDRGSTFVVYRRERDKHESG